MKKGGETIFSPIFRRKKVIFGAGFIASPRLPDYIFEKLKNMEEAEEMFTGLVECTGVIVGMEMRGNAGSLAVRPATAFADLKRGESIAVNGACLTLEREESGGVLVFHALAETFSRCNLGALGVGGQVNLERALRVGDRLGGHMVTGHVDCRGEVLGWEERDGDLVLRVGYPAELAGSLVEKGSICIDGVSLTVSELGEGYFEARIIPTTLSDTALSVRVEGDAVNLEGDILGKYVERQLSLGIHGGREGRIDMDMLVRAGW